MSDSKFKNIFEEVMRPCKCCDCWKERGPNIFATLAAEIVYALSHKEDGKP